MNIPSHIGIIILAAGRSFRFGSPKQLALFEGKTLIERISETAISTGFPTTVVLGANSEKITDIIKDLELKTVVNKEWETGMSSSIRRGLDDLIKRVSGLSAVVILLCDQPFVDTGLINNIVETHRKTGKKIVASSYGETVGTPALFACALFDELFELSGDRGAKGLINKYRDSELALISAPKAQIDIDTIEDFRKLS